MIMHHRSLPRHPAGQISLSHPVLWGATTDLPYNFVIWASPSNSVLGSWLGFKPGSLSSTLSLICMLDLADYICRTLLGQVSFTRLLKLHWSSLLHLFARPSLIKSPSLVCLTFTDQVILHLFAWRSLIKSSTPGILSSASAVTISTPGISSSASA